MTFATRQRLLLGLAVLMMLIPTMLLAGGKLGQSPLFDGDTRKEMTCLTCDGLGRVKEEGCPTCRGTGVGEYIIPGTNRPIQLVGTVLEGAKKPLANTEIEAQVVGQEGSIGVATNDSGQFGLKLPPGNYRLSFKHPDGKHLEQDFTVVPNDDPIPVRGPDSLHVIEKTFTL